MIANLPSVAPLDPAVLIALISMVGTVLLAIVSGIFARRAESKLNKVVSTGEEIHKLTNTNYTELSSQLKLALAKIELQNAVLSEMRKPTVGPMPVASAPAPAAAPAPLAAGTELKVKVEEQVIKAEAKT